MKYIWLILLSLVSELGVTKAQEPVKMGKLKSPKLTEVSGIVSSCTHSNLFWVHNDSGDKANIYLIDTLADLKATVHLAGINVVDAEDIASLMIDGVPYLLLADMGNNLRNRDTLSLFLFKEPVLDKLNKSYVVAREDIMEIKFRYKDKRRDAEALFVDPIDNMIYIISKRDFRSTLFRMSFSDAKLGAVLELSPLMQLPLTFATAADIRQDGRYIAIKNLTSIFLWRRDENQDILSALKRPYTLAPYEIEPQGEAICFDRNKRRFYTISERPFGLDSYLYAYEY
ncbi:hypothetical protein [Sphingobacterium tabacisoli]|uniref:Uncharacterized protein n=1 Tax=Sphingobacterium tabacisoli TaxID=2044855 RepID=A0ABW5L4J4_9SPHI|nr:hypothetical protein [Sphingobacterium tabacisoli]